MRGGARKGAGRPSTGMDGRVSFRVSKHVIEQINGDALIRGITPSEVLRIQTELRWRCRCEECEARRETGTPTNL